MFLSLSKDDLVSSIIIGTIIRKLVTFPNHQVTIVFVKLISVVENKNTVSVPILALAIAPIREAKIKFITLFSLVKFNEESVENFIIL